MPLLYTVNVPLLAGLLYSGLPQRIPKNLLYTVNVPLLAGSTIFRVTSAYTNASTLYGECTYNLIANKQHIIAGLYSGLSQRIPMHLYFIR